MAEPYLGEIRMFAGNFAPRDWMFCNGQLLSIAAYQALFSLIFTTYGGDGRSTFRLPDMRGRIPVHSGHGPGTQVNFILGEYIGSESITLTDSNLPTHTHGMNAYSGRSNTSSPDGALMSLTSEDSYAYDSQNPISPDVTMYSDSLSNAGGTQSHNNMQPFLCVSFIICVEFGIYPSRN